MPPTARRLAGNIGEISMVDVVMGLAEGLPTGIYHNRGIEEYVADVLSDPAGPTTSASSTRTC